MGKKQTKKPQGLKKYSVSYHKTRVRVPYPRNPRLGQCRACLRRRGVELKVTQLHHTCYAYSTKRVKANPLLALDNTLELGYTCHRIADGFRNLLDGTNDKRMMQVVKLLPDHQLRKLFFFCKRFITWYNNGGKRNGQKE